MDAKELAGKIERLSPEQQRMVLEFVERLLREDSSADRERRLSFSWAGALSELKVSSVELQHKLSDWW